jgi:Undecaprenyl-phosphate glucose phosphotransferase
MVLIFLWKFSFLFWLKLYRSKGFNLRNVVVVGYGELAEDLTKFFKQHPEFGFKLMGFFDNQAENPKIVGKLETIREYSLANKVDQIYCCLPYLKYSQVDEIIRFADANLIKVKLIADLRGFSSKGLELEKYDHIPVINVTAIPLDITKNKIVKRTFDIGFSFLIIVLLLSWLLPILSILIKLDSKGPVFFLQKRTGKNNKDFWCLKLRTMRVNDDANYKQATKGDDRITKLGQFLRKTSLDELPQFINVFLGDMSIVGPRPHMLTHTEKYSQVIDKFMHRHLIKPGITGLAQAKGYRGETKSLLLMKNRVKLDRFYVENWTMLLDLKIVVLTIMSMIKGNENAY